MATEVGSAYVSIWPKIDGSQWNSEIKNAIGGVDTKSSGLSMGKEMSSGITSGLTAAKVAIGNVIANVVMSGMSAISSSIDSAISRVDTLNNFPKVMSNIGFSSESASKSVDTLGKAIDGLPTKLDEIVQNTQSFALSLGDLDKATDVAIAVNDGMLAFGASSEAASNAVVQLNQMITAGTYDMQSWTSINSSAPGMLDSIARSMLGEAASASELREALNKGSISTEDFLNAIIKMDTEGGAGFASFAQLARESTGGIATSISNAKNAVSKNIANIINAFNGAGAIPKVFDAIKLAINSFGSVIVPIAEIAGEAFSGVADIFVDAMTGFSEACSRFTEGFRLDFGQNKSIILAFLYGLESAFAGTPLLTIFSTIDGVVRAFFFTLQDGGSIVEAIKNALDEFAVGTVSLFDDLEAAFTKTPLADVFTTLDDAVRAFVFTLQDGGSFIDAFKNALDEIPLKAQAIIGALSLIGGALVFSKIASTAKLAANSVMTIGTTAATAASKIPILGGAVTSLQGQVRAFSATTATFGGGIAGATKVISAGFGNAVSAMGSKMNAFGSAVALSGGGLKGVTSAIAGMISPVGIAVAVIGALAAIFAVLWNTNDEFRESMTALGQELMSALQPSIESILQAFQQMATAVMPAVIAVVQALVPLITLVVTTVAELIAAVLPVLADILAAIIVPVITMIAELLAAVIPVIVQIISVILQVVATIISAAMPVITQIATLIQTVLPIIQTIFETVMGAVKTIIEDVWPAIQTIIETVMTVIQDVINIILAAINGDWDAVWSGIGQLIDDIWNGIQSIVTSCIEAVQAVITDVLTAISDLWNSIWTDVSTFVSDVWEDVCDAVDQGVNDVLDFVGGLPDAIMGFFSDAGSWLLDAGKNILDGLLGGLKAAWDGVCDFVGGIGDWIINNKGPEEYDRKMLIPAGKWIMQGLQKGLNIGFGEVISDIQSMTKDIESKASAKVATKASYEVDMMGKMVGSSLASGYRNNPTIKGGDVNVYATVKNSNDVDKLAVKIAAKQDRSLKACALL